MHPTSLENMRKCYKRYIEKSQLAHRPRLRVLDVGGADVNGSYRDVFSAPNIEYIGADLQPAPGVALVLQEPYKIPLEDGSVDVAISGQMLEHCEYFWLTFAEMMRVLSKDGVMILIAPSAGGIHRHPVDCYRFYPDSYAALAKLVGCHLIYLWHDDRGPWKDLVGVFSWTAHHQPALQESSFASPGATSQAAVRSDASSDAQAIAAIRSSLQPGMFLETGADTDEIVWAGKGVSVSVDPSPAVSRPESARSHVVRMTSDDFFEFRADELLKPRPGLILIGASRPFEQVLRDFMNAERRASPGTVILVTGVAGHSQGPDRDRTARSGRTLLACLSKERPDLFVLQLDTSPAGLALIYGLDARNRRLWDRYNGVLRTWPGLGEAETDEFCKGAAVPATKLTAVLSLIQQAKTRKEPLRATIGSLRKAIASTVTP